MRSTVQDGRILTNKFCFGKKKRQILSYFLFWQPEIWLLVLFYCLLLFKIIALFISRAAGLGFVKMCAFLMIAGILCFVVSF